MAIGFSGSIVDFLSLDTLETFGATLSEGRKNSGGFSLSEQEKNVWNKDFELIARVLKESDISKEGTFLLIEYDIPGHLGRCDFLIIGGSSDGTKNIAVVENKSWVSFEPSNDEFYVSTGNQLHLNPCKQVLGYSDNIKYFHSIGKDFDIIPCVLFTRCTNDFAIQTITQSDNACKIWSLNNSNSQIAEDLGSYFNGGISVEEFREFRDGQFKQSSHFAPELLKHFPNITRGVAKAISGKPIDLTVQQEEVVLAVNHFSKQNQKTLFLVRGTPGSGKTIVGLHALAHQLAFKPDSRVVMALRNNRLCTVVRKSIDDAGGPRAGKILVQYVKSNQGQHGIFYQVSDANDSDLPLYDLLIADEAHRIPHINPNSRGGADLSQLQSLLKAGKVVCCLVDEGQVLNEDDSGTHDLIKKIWGDLFPTSRVIEISLEEQHRLPPKQMNWTENFLNQKIVQNCEDYLIKVVDSPNEIIEFLNNYTENNQCGLLASYTFSNGRRGNTLRVPSLGIHWLMDTKEYELWWRNRAVRHQFNKCSSVYGCQGFELDYAGLFWGKDLFIEMENNQPSFLLKPNHEITDDIGMAYGKKFKTLANEALSTRNSQLAQRVIVRLINRYRILLSRARKGLVIFCEDKQTSESLKKCIALSRGD